VRLVGPSGPVTLVDVGDGGTLTGTVVEGVVELDGVLVDVVVGNVPVDGPGVPVGTAGGVSGIVVVVVLELAGLVASVITGAVVVLVVGSAVADDSGAVVVVVVVPVVDVPVVDVVVALVVVVAGTIPVVVVFAVVVVTDGGSVVAAPAENAGVARTAKPTVSMMAPGNTVASRATRLLELCVDKGIQALTFGCGVGRTSPPPRRMIAL
jgi:hypothetical protein